MKKNLYTLLVLALVACSPDYDEPQQYIPYTGENVASYDESKIFINNHLSPINEYTFNYIYKESDDLEELSGQFQYDFKVNITQPASENITVKLAVLDNYADQYNNLNNTDFVDINAGCYTFLSDEVIIEKGQTESKNYASIKIEKCDELKGLRKEVMLPVSIISINGDTTLEGKVSKNLSNVYIFGKLSLSLENIAEGNNPIEGELINRASWKISATSNYDGYPASNLIDGNKESTWIDIKQYEDDNKATVSVDLGKNETLKGIVLSPGWFNDTEMFFPEKMEIMTSNDGVFFISQGIFELGNPSIGVIYNIKFKKSVDAKYFRVKILSETASPFALGEVNAVR